MFVEAIVLFLFILLIEVNILLDCPSCPIFSAVVKCEHVFQKAATWFGTVKCLFPENIHISRRLFCLDDPTQCTCHCPSPLEFPWFSHLVGYSLERIFLSKMPMHYTSIYAISFPSDIAAFWTPFPLSSEYPLSFLCVYGYFLELHNLGDCK